MDLVRDPIPADIARYLESGYLGPTPSEAHGMLCGLICAGEPKPVETWLIQLAPSGESEPGIADAQFILRDWAAGILAQFQSPDQILDLPSPGESTPLRERALWLYDWIRGFLYGLGLHAGRAPAYSTQMREAIADLTAITRMDLDHLDDSEENEQALVELIEFVRIAVLLIHAEGVSADQSQPKPAVAS